MRMHVHTNNHLMSILVEVLSYLVFLMVAGSILAVVQCSFDWLIANAVLLTVVYAVALLASGRGWIAMAVSAVTVFAAYYADACVFAARLTHIRVTDFTLIGQAAGVASHYTPTWSWEQTWRLLIIVVAAVILCLVCRYYGEPKPTSMRRVGGVSAILCVCCFVAGISTGFFDVGTGTFNMNREVVDRGLVGSWIAQASRRGSEMPDGYNVNDAETYLASYDQGDESEVRPTPVDLVVVMNESLADYALLGKTSFHDPLPGLHSLVDAGKAFEGKLAVSVFGGGTCNTEWEFLTGNSLAFLPEEACPFLDYVTSETKSLARDLELYGYSSAFLHPYYSQEWNRKSVYSLLGFDSATFGEDMGSGFLNSDEFGNATSMGRMDFGSSLDYVRGFVSDREAYAYLLNSLPSDSNDENPAFYFCVTVQNHGGYSYEGDDFTATEYVSEELKYDRNDARVEVNPLPSSPPSANQYLTLCSISDEALMELFDTLEARDRHTIVLVFGDHQPALSFDSFMKYDENLLIASDEQRHVVPYFVWSNRELEYDFPDYVSANYLSALLKDCAGIPLDEYDRLRLDAMRRCPVITTGYALGPDRELLDTQSDEVLRKYSWVQYMRMFDEGA